MRSVISVFWNICLLRRGPEVVPTHPWFMATVVLADVAVSLLLSIRFAPELPILPGLTYILVTMAVTASITWFVLYLRDVEPRFPATITALYGCDLLLSSLLLIVGEFARLLNDDVMLGITALMSIWSIAVAGFILHRAMGVTVLVGMLVAFGMALFGVSVGQVAGAG